MSIPCLGIITILDSVPPTRVVFDLHMIAPFEGRNAGTISLNQTAAATTVTWSVDDRHTLMLKVIGLLVNLDKKTGDAFEAGLAKLKAVSEKAVAQK